MKKRKLILPIVMAALTLSGCENVVGSSAADSGGAGITDTEFSDLTKFTQSRFTDELKIKLSALRNQCLIMKTYFSDFADELRGKLGGSNNSAIMQQLQFANSVTDIEGYIASAFAQRNVPAQKGYIEGYLDDLTDEIAGMYASESAGNKWKAKIKAYRLGKYLGQRQHYLSPADKDSKEAEFFGAIAAVNQIDPNANLSTSSVYSAMHSLTFQLKNEMPNSCGKDAKSFLLQYEDTIQFDAWTDEAEDLGFSIIIPKEQKSSSETAASAAPRDPEQPAPRSGPEAAEDIQTQSSLQEPQLPPR
jgi:hypothetical protein